MAGGGPFRDSTVLIAGPTGGGKVGARISTLTDAIVLLRYWEMGEEPGRGPTMIKMRGGRHGRHVRRFSIGSDGLHVGPPVPNVAHLIGNLPG